MKAVGEADWLPLVEVGVVMLTLTYPDGLFSSDHRRNVRHWQKFVEAWAYRFGERPRGTICIEFQEGRGAPHWHAYLGMPAGVNILTLEGWVRDSWGKIIGAERETIQFWHRRDMNVIVRRFPAFEPNRAGAYFWMHQAKGAQKQVPDGYLNLRRWAWVFGLERRKHSVEVCSTAYVHYRRVLHRLVEKKVGRKLPRRGRVQGEWYLSDDGIGTAVRLVRWAREMCGCNMCVA